MGLFLDPEAAAQIPGPPNAAGRHDRAAGGRELPGEAKLAILQIAGHRRRSSVR